MYEISIRFNSLQKLRVNMEDSEKIIDDIIVKLQILEKDFIWLPPTSDFLESFVDLARVSGVELPPEKIKELGQKVKAVSETQTVKSFSSFKIPSVEKDSEKDATGLFSSFKISSAAKKELMVGIRYIKLTGKLSELSCEDLQCLWKELSGYHPGTQAYQSFCKTLVILHGPNFIIR